MTWRDVAVRPFQDGHLADTMLPALLGAGMKRRGFICLVTGAAAWAHGARAQQAASVRRIGVLSPFSPAGTLLWNKALLQGLRDSGWAEGKNLAIEYRYAEGKKERLPELVADLIRLKVDLIVTTVTLDTLAARNATAEIPIVMVAVGDPVATGFVRSLARPGGNITGLSQMTPDLSGKRLELLKQIVPDVSAVALFYNPEDQLSILDWKEARLSAQRLGIEVHSLEVRNAVDLEKGLREAVTSRVGALAIVPAPILFENLKPIADFAMQARLPSIFHLREFAAAGGLVSYGVDRSDLFRRAATYVDKILKGANPADLPVQQPTKFELVINLRTARTLGLTISPNLLGIADEVIE
jgi:putative tryptophan/tyrosine transport system substrate-binding protein